MADPAEVGSDGPMGHSRTIVAGIALALVTLLACSSDDGGSSSGSSAAEEGGTSGGGGVEAGGGTSPDGSSGSIPDAGADTATSGGGPGIQLTAAGTSYSLADNPSAAQGGNGWLIGAAKIDGAKMRNLALILNKAEAGPQYVPLTPGAYPCTMPGVAPFTWARVQYVTPDGSTYQSASTAAGCTVTLTEFGAVGQAVKGSFTATLDRVAGSEATPVAISGTFDVIRKN